MKQTILLTIEKSPGNKTMSGRVLYNDNLIVDAARSVKSLENQFKKLLHDFHDVDPKTVEFEHAYDLTSLFDKYKYFNISAVAKKVKINPSLMRQYAAGNKFPSPETAAKIEKAIHEIAKEMLSIRVSTPSTRGTGVKKRKRQLAEK
jgi:hypothetical protein